MKTLRLHAAGLAVLGLTGGIIFGLEEEACLAQSVQHVREASPWLTPNQALRATLETGKPTLIVITSQEGTASQELMRSLRENAITQRLGQLAYVSEFLAEQAPEEVTRLGVESLPAVVAYRRGALGLEFVASQNDIRDAYHLIGWVRAHVVGPASTSAVDRSVARAAYHDEQPSPQAYPPASPPAKFTPPSPPTQFTPQTPPTYYVSVPAPASTLPRSRPLIW